MPGKAWAAAAGGLLLVLILALAAPAAQAPLAYLDLQAQLVRQGLEKNYVLQTFNDPRNVFLPDVVRKIAYLKKEPPSLYERFLRPEVAAQGRAYMQAHRATLKRAEAAYGVAPEVIVAILTVESGLGQITGKYPVFNVFASLAVMDAPEVIRDLGLPTRLKDRLKKKAAWGRRELAIFMQYCAAKRLDPFSFKGSWAGAMGYCQFLPSSLKNCGADGDGDGKVDLFNHDDAIFSIAKYLHQSGFQRQNRASWRRAVLRYNHSDAYADCVITLATWY
jgi:membrane-bound lytic murein transglycosylase B